MSENDCDTAFRIKSVVKMLHRLLVGRSPNYITTEALVLILDNEHCCSNCVHQCTTCKGECMDKPECFKFHCQHCGVAANDCEFHKIMKAHSVCMELSNIQQEECKNFEVFNTSFAAFPHCRTLMQLFHYHIFDAINSTSTFLLKKKNIDLEKHEDNLMNARMIFRLTVENLRYLLDESNALNMFDEDTTNLAHQAEEEALAYNLAHRFEDLYELNGGDKEKEWKFNDLHALIMNGKFDKLHALFTYEPYYKELVDSEGYSFPFMCTKENNANAMSYLIKEGFDILENINGTTVFHRAAEFGSLEVLNVLMENKREGLNIKNNHLLTPLHVACLKNQIPIAEFLAQQPGIKVNKQDYWGRTPLHYACRNNNLKMVSLLVDHKSIDVDVKNKNNNAADESTTDLSIKRKIRRKRDQK